MAHDLRQIGGEYAPAEIGFHGADYALIRLLFLRHQARRPLLG